MAISFQTQNTDFVLKNKTKIKSWITKVIDKEKKKTGQLNFVFMPDEELLQNNIRFLNHDTYTDIITFDYCEATQINGDILISIERVKENAQKFKVDFDTELRRVIIHGVLHLCGYKDKTKADSALMRLKEQAALNIFPKK